MNVLNMQLVTLRTRRREQHGESTAT